MMHTISCICFVGYSSLAMKEDCIRGKKRILQLFYLSSDTFFLQYPIKCLAFKAALA